MNMFEKCYFGKSFTDTTILIYYKESWGFPKVYRQVTDLNILKTFRFFLGQRKLWLIVNEAELFS